MTERPTDTVALSLPIEDVQDALASNLSAARSALGLSQDQLATAACVSRATVNQLEGGSTAKGDPRLSTVVQLAAALGISPVFLLLGRDDLDAITEAPKSNEVRDVRSHLTAEELETMRRVLRSGVAKNRAKAVEMGATAAATAGMTAGDHRSGRDRDGALAGNRHGHRSRHRQHLAREENDQREEEGRRMSAPAPAKITCIAHA